MKSSIDTAFVKTVFNQTNINRLFNQNQNVVIAFLAQWCPPSKNLKSQLILSAQKSKNFILALIDVDDPENESLNKKFQTNCIPAIFLCNHNLDNKVYSFVGCNFQKLNQLIKKTYQIKNLPVPVPKLKNKQYQCHQGHKLDLITELPHPYPANTYQCDECKNVDIASSNKPMLHCFICSYDLCNNCSHE